MLDLAGQAAKVGVTTDEIDELVHTETIKRGGSVPLTIVPTSSSIAPVFLSSHPLCSFRSCSLASLFDVLLPLVTVAT